MKELRSGTIKGRRKHKLRDTACESESRVSWRYADHVIHALANKIVDSALLHASQVVIEDLSAISQGPQHKRPKLRPRTNLSKVLNRAQYQKLANVLGTSYQL